MQLIPIQTSILKEGDDLAEILLSFDAIQDGDIVVVSSKACATVEGAAIDLGDLDISPEAKTLLEKSGTHKTLPHVQAILNETTRMNGRIILSSQEGVILTELNPNGFTQGRILVTNAGLDLSNVQDGYAIGWPVDPVTSTVALQQKLGNVGVIMSDSGLQPRREGVMAFALACSGVDPIMSKKGAPDLFGRELHFTEEAVADQLCTAANFLMGNSNECTPAAIIRDHGLTLSDYEGWVPGIAPEKDIYHGLI